MASLSRTAKSIFLEAVEKYQPEQWDVFLDGACGDDAELRLRAEDLLKAHEGADSLLDASAATVDLPAGEVEPGTMIGRYKLLQQIGEGGFGVVFMAEQQQPVRRKVALKVIKPGMDSKAVVGRFESERQALAMMDHPNIARVYDGGATESGRPYFVMELVKGVPITEYCDKNQLPTDERLKLFMTVCQAVQHAHQKGIIHRDLKPSNVLVTLADGQPVVKVIDFGVAKATNQQLTEKTLFTAFGQMIGTPQYMSPEQAEMSCLDVDTRSDVYSLGVLLYELLTGSTPLEAEQLRTAGYAEMQRLIREEEPLKPSTRLSTSGDQLTIIAKHRSVSPERLKSQVKGDLDWIVMKVLEKDRNRRYESPNELAKELNRFLLSEPVIARPPTIGYRITKYIKRHRAAIATVSVLLLSLSAGLLSTLQQKSVAIAEAERANQILVKYQDQIEMNALDAILGGSPDARSLIEDASQAMLAEGKIQWLTALADVHEGHYGKVVDDLTELRARTGGLSVAAHAVLATAHFRNGIIDKYASEVERLRVRKPVSITDRLLVAHALAGVSKDRSESLLREVVEQRDTPVTRAMCAHSMAWNALVKQNSDLAVEAADYISVAEIMAPELQIVNDYSVFVRTVAMSHSMGETREHHKLRALQSASSQDRGPFGELARATLYWTLDELELAKETFIAGVAKGDMNAYWCAPFLQITSPETALDEFLTLDFAVPDGAGALGARAFLLAQTRDRRHEAIEICNQIAERFQDYDTRLDARCVSLIAGDPNVRATAKRLLPSTICDFELTDESFELLAGTRSLDELIELSEKVGDSGVAHYTIGAWYLSRGERDIARKYFRLSADCPDFFSAYTLYSRAILSQLDADIDWPAWLPEEPQIPVATK